MDLEGPDRLEGLEVPEARVDLFDPACRLFPRCFLGNVLYRAEARVLRTSLPTEVLWGSFVTHSFLPHGEK